MMTCLDLVEEAITRREEFSYYRSSIKNLWLLPQMQGSSGRIKWNISNGGKNG
jgi:hypothetical protein